MARSAVSDIEHGRRQVDPLELARLAWATGPDVDLPGGRPRLPPPTILPLPARLRGRA